MRLARKKSNIQGARSAKLNTIVFIMLLLVAPTPVNAAWHLYIMPYTTQGNPPHQTLRPNFDGVIDPDLVSFRVLRYGGQPIVLVAADVSDAIDALLAARPNITKVPDNLDQQVGPGAALIVVRDALEDRSIPGQWVVATTTYRTILRVLYGAATLLRRYRAVSGNFGAVLTGAVTLDTTFSQLPLKARTDLLTTAAALKIDTKGFTDTLTLRQILKGVGDQYANRPFTLGGITI